jgi:hypothetical protein
MKKKKTKKIADPNLKSRREEIKEEGTIRKSQFDEVEKRRISITYIKCGSVYDF